MAVGAEVSSEVWVGKNLLATNTPLMGEGGVGVRNYALGLRAAHFAPNIIRADPL